MQFLILYGNERKKIVYKYIKIRLHSYVKFYVQNVLQPERKRHRLTKQILFLHEQTF